MVHFHTKLIRPRQESTVIQVTRMRKKMKGIDAAWSPQTAESLARLVPWLVPGKDRDWSSPHLKAKRAM